METQRFKDLRSAGRALAPRLVAYKNQPDVSVLGIALAGVPLAYEVASFLQTPLDLILIRRLLAGDGIASHLCAVNVAGETILDDGIFLTDRRSTPLEDFLQEAMTAFSQREKLCRRERPPLALANRTIIAVDCGIRTGSTMKAAARALRKINARRIVAAVPVSSMEGHAEVAPLFDEFVCILKPEQFVNAGFWYSDFRRPGDEEVGELLE